MSTDEDLSIEQVNATSDGRITIRLDAARLSRLDLIVAAHGVTPSEVFRSAFDAACIQLGVLSDRP